MTKSRSSSHAWLKDLLDALGTFLLSQLSIDSQCIVLRLCFRHSFLSPLLRLYIIQLSQYKCCCLTIHMFFRTLCRKTIYAEVGKRCNRGRICSCLPSYPTRDGSGATCTAVILKNPSFNNRNSTSCRAPQN